MKRLIQVNSARTYPALGTRDRWFLSASPLRDDPGISRTLPLSTLVTTGYLPDTSCFGHEPGSALKNEYLFTVSLYVGTVTINSALPKVAVTVPHGGFRYFHDFKQRSQSRFFTFSWMNAVWVSGRAHKIQWSYHQNLFFQMIVRGFRSAVCCQFFDKFRFKIGGWQLKIGKTTCTYLFCPIFATLTNLIILIKKCQKLN